MLKRRRQPANTAEHCSEKLETKATPPLGLPSAAATANYLREPQGRKPATAADEKNTAREVADLPPLPRGVGNTEGVSDPEARRLETGEKIHSAVYRVIRL